MRLALFAVAFLAATAVAEDKFPDLKSEKWEKQDNGMKTWDAKEGKGDGVKAGEKVKVHYTGWLTDGTKFDSSRDGKNEPITFGLDQVIKGWGVGVVGMKPGGVRRLVIPPELAYGNKDRDPIPANSTLVFEIELIEVVK